MYHSNQNGLFFLGALAGGVVATLTTLLFTTKKGEEIKNKIVEKCHELEDGLSHAKDKVEEGAQDAQASMKKNFDKLKKEV